MARFTNKDPGLGFDAGVQGALPWQMVPRGGARGILLHDGPDLDIEIRPTPPSGVAGGLTYSETVLQGVKHREIWLQGSKPGEYAVSAVSPRSGAAVAWLAANVVTERVVKIAYYFLPGARRWPVRVLHDRAHNILHPQAHVTLEYLGEWGNEMGERIELPSQIDLNNSEQRIALMEYGNHHGADLLVYFGWKIATAERDRVTNAETLGNKCVIDGFRRPVTEVARMARTLAHEIGHFISSPGHDDKPTDLMFGDSSKSPGTVLRRTRILKIGRPG